MLSMAADNPALAASLQHGMHGGLQALLEGAHFLGQGVHLDSAPAGAVVRAVKDVSDGDHAVALPGMARPAAA